MEEFTSNVILKDFNLETYCFRQLCLFGVFCHCGCGQSQIKEYTHLLTWFKNQNKTDSNTAVWQHNLDTVVQHELWEHETRGLFADSYIKQNKNKNWVITLLGVLRWSFSLPSLKEVKTTPAKTNNQNKFKSERPRSRSQTIHLWA